MDTVTKLHETAQVALTSGRKVTPCLHFAPQTRDLNDALALDVQGGGGSVGGGVDGDAPYGQRLTAQLKHILRQVSDELSGIKTAYKLRCACIM